MYATFMIQFSLGNFKEKSITIKTLHVPIPTEKVFQNFSSSQDSLFERAITYSDSP